MIVSASYKTDIPAFYRFWFEARLADGVARAINPWGGRMFEVPLDRASVDGFVFWTRNVEPFLPTLDRLHADGWPFVVQMTITGYPRSLERSVIDIDRAVGQIWTLAKRFGKRSVVWRYDPVLITEATPAAFHRDRVDRLAAALVGAVDEATLSFATIYRKTRANLDRAGLAWRDPCSDEKRTLLSELAERLASHGLRPTLCSQPKLLVDGLEGAACIDADRLSDVAGRPISSRIKGNRPGCLCAESRDIGAYDTCPHGCLYCYAVSRPETAKQKHQAHDVSNACLIEPIERTG
ncbi:MAG: DUF1848 domain-containing protein [Alphaproteobacteria bacterium]|nr:DUF1848 domain-containing protein [Alphaproteobacteria bacterium]